jgi:ABC-type bacteriocin/lantibiotic exporter with double-glycine peptidase domain
VIRRPDREPAQPRRRLGPAADEPGAGKAKAGRPKMSLANLLALFRGSEGASIVKPTRNIPVGDLFRFFLPALKPYKKPILIVLALILLVPIAQGARIYMVKLTVDDVLLPQKTDPLTWIIPVTLGITVVL